MPQPEGKIYNDAPDEFAEFIDSGRVEVSLRDLGGPGNPFLKEGIYKGTSGAPSVSDAYFSIDHSALAEFMSRGLGCRVCRQFKKTGWQFGTLRGYDVYFACAPTAGMYRALESTPKSILIIGQNTPKTLPSEIATRVIYLSRLLYVRDGGLHFAQEVVEEKIPKPRAAAAGKSPRSERPKRQSRPPVQVYTPYYLSMMGEWLDTLRREDGAGRPSKEWIVEWLRKNGPSFCRRGLSERQVYRHIDRLTAREPPARGMPDFRSDVFAAHWNGCLDRNYVARFSTEDLAEAIMKAFAVAKKMGYDIRPMRSMDAAEFADKVLNGNGGDRQQLDRAP